MNMRYTLSIWLIVMSFWAVAQEYQRIDGSNNNLSFPERNAEGTPLQYISETAYIDGISAPTGVTRLNPRAISNMLFAQSELLDNKLVLSDYIWVFGQFIDHDVTLVGEDEHEFFPIVVPDDDQHFSPGSLIPMTRSIGIQGTGTSPDNPRRVANIITGWIDGSAVYGHTDDWAQWLRTGEAGKLKLSAGDLLPWNTIDGEFNSDIDPTAPGVAGNGTRKLFIAGDTRVNENVLLTSMHTVWAREHNRICDEIIKEFPGLDDEEIYLRARRKVIGMIQAITYEEWLPAMGVELQPYTGYDASIDASISNVFSAAAYRWGHSLLNTEIKRIMKDGTVHPDGHLTLREAFFNPRQLIESGGIEPLLQGMGAQMSQELDCKVIDDVRNFLFGPPSAGGLDLASINIQRGRERGVKDLNGVREDYGLSSHEDWSDITSVASAAADMEAVYGDINDIDAWVGMLAEDHEEGALFGSTIMEIMKFQFSALRDGDRFYYESDPVLSSKEKAEIKKTRMYDVLMRNTDIEIMQTDVFSMIPTEDVPGSKAYVIEKNLDLVVFPNPTVDELYIKIYYDSDQRIDLRLTDMSGRVIETGSFNTLAGKHVKHLPLSISGLVPGYYELHVSDGISTNRVRFLKH